MAPFSRRKELENINYNNLNAKESAVMALVYPNEANAMQMVFIQRKSNSGVHSNQIGFPGGKVEKTDANYLETALRETEEEIGVKTSTVKLIRPLTKLYIPPSNFIVFPFLGFLDHQPKFILQETEVECVYSILLADCLNPINEAKAEVSASYAKKMMVNAFNFNNRIVWGATAMMLAEIKSLMLDGLADKSVYPN